MKGLSSLMQKILEMPWKGTFIFVKIPRKKIH